MTKHRPKISRRDRCDERACLGSKVFCMWTQIKLLGPSRTMLRMQIPIAVSDHIRVQQAVRPLPLSNIRNLAKDLIALGGAVDDNVSDVNTAWPEFACEGLTDHPEASFSGSECSKCCSSAKSCWRAGVDDRPVAAWQ